jgi:transcriptional regulator with XRE-family HTH domain
MADVRDQLREFLRSHRDRLSPAELGIADDRPRRVPGVRREEVARLAGVSVDYYTRLEQGRDVSIAADVVDAIADALRLTDDERRALFELAQPTRPRRRSPARQRIRHSIGGLVEMLPASAVLVGRRLDVLATNHLATVLLGDFAATPRNRGNQARWVFLDPVARSRYLDWEGVARDSVEDLRDQFARHPDDPRLAALITELSNRSDQFARWWEGGERQSRHFGPRRYHHPAVGELTLIHEALIVADAEDQVVYIDFAEPGSSSDVALRRLASEPSQ